MSAEMATATEAGEPVGLSEHLSARRTEDQQRRRRQLYWADLLTSLWAPLTAIAVALVPYLLVVELHPPSASWAEPLMRRLGFACVCWFVALGVLRVVLRGWSELRHLRHEARQATSDVDGALRSKGPALEAKLREKLVEQAARVDSATLGTDAGELLKQTRDLVGLAARIPGYRRHTTRDVVSGLLKAVLVALLIRAVLIEPFRIPSGSMLPTLEIGDQIFVNKFIYGVRLPFRNVVPFVLVRRPERGDVIVFNNPVNTSEDWIKRVVGVPGDTIEARGSDLLVNGELQPRTLLSADHPVWDRPRDRDWQRVSGRLYQETLDGHPHQLLEFPEDHRKDGEGKFVVPPGVVFVMGDNRDNSTDSRFGLGGSEHPAFVPYDNIKGKAMIVWLSIGPDGFLSSLFHSWAIRASRFFHPVR